MVPKPDSRIELGDLLHLVGERHALHKVLLVLGGGGHLPLHPRDRSAC